MKKIYTPLCALLLLTGCASAQKNISACPETGLIANASSAAFFATTTQNPTAQDISTRVALQDINGTCRMARKNDETMIDLNFNIIGARTEIAGNIPIQNVSYFIAVLDPQENILQRQNFYATVALDETGQGLQTEEHRIRIPLTTNYAPRQYKVAVGFILTPQQLAFNKTHPEGT